MINDLKKNLIIFKELVGDDKNPEKIKVEALKEWFKKTIDPEAFTKIGIKLASNSRTVIAKKNFKANDVILSINSDLGAIDLSKAA